MKYKKAVGAVVATSILIVVAVASIVVFQNWYSSYSSELMNSVEHQASHSSMYSGIEDMANGKLYFNNGEDSNITIDKVEIEGNDCDYSSNVTTGLHTIDVSLCVSNLNTSAPDAVVYTNKGIFSKNLYFDTSTTFSSCTLDGITQTHAQNYTFYDESLVAYGESCLSLVRVCDDGIYNGDTSFNYSSCSVEGQDTMPDTFSFTNQSGVNISTTIVSNSLVPTGYNGDLSVGVQGDGTPELRINGGSWTASGVLNSGDSLEVRMVSSGSYETSNIVNVSAGDYSTLWDVTTRAQDVTPNAFSFTNQDGVSLNSQTSSNTITPSGYEGPLSVSVSGDGSPELSIGGGSWTTSSSINPGETLQLRLTSSSSYDSTNTATITLGDYSTLWNITTKTQDTIPDAFSFTNQSEVSPNTQTSSNTITPSGYDGPLSVSVSGDGGPELRVEGGSWTTSSSMNPGETLQLRLTSSSNYYTKNNATITLGSYSTKWSVKTLTYEVGGCGSETVKDYSTGYCWDRDFSRLGQHTWENAISECESLTHPTSGTWELPGYNELKTLQIDSSTPTPRIVGGNNNYFNNVQTDDYWSDYVGNSYSVQFDSPDGWGDSDHPSQGHYVVCILR